MIWNMWVKNLENPMGRSLNDLFKKGRRFLDDISDSERILLIYHKDGDGYCSGAIFLRALENLGKVKNVTALPAINEDLEDLVKNEATHYDKIIILDIDAPYLMAKLEEIPGKIMIIDHHSIRNDMNNDKIVYINP